CIAAPHPVILVQAKEVEKGLLKVGDGRFPDSNLGDAGRFCEHNVKMRERFLEIGRSHPSGGSAAEDYDSFDEPRLHSYLIRLIHEGCLSQSWRVSRKI